MTSDGSPPRRNPRLNQRQRAFVAVFALLTFGYLQASPTMPPDPDPCQGWQPKDPTRMVISWEADHPMSTAVLSAMTLGLWSPRFTPAACSYSDLGRGYPLIAWPWVRARSFEVYKKSRVVLGFFVIMLYARFLVVPALRSSASALDLWRSRRAAQLTPVLQRQLQAEGSPQTAQE